MGTDAWMYNIPGWFGCYTYRGDCRNRIKLGDVAMQWGITVYDGIDKLSKVIYRQDMPTQQACIEWLYCYVGAARIEHYERSYSVFLGGQVLRQL